MNIKTRQALAEIDWRSPNTHVFFAVQVIGVVWVAWFITRWFTGSLSTTNLCIMSAMIVVRYDIGMWFVTAWRHRYFAHRSFRINPRFIWIEPWIAFICSADAQRGVCQWATEHIEHHKYSDTPKDHHSCLQRGFAWCHLLWVVKKGSDRQVNWSLIPQLSKNSWIKWIENRQWIGIVIGGLIFSVIGAIFSVGEYRSFLFNLVFSLCGYFFSTTLLWHGTFLINSATHLIGRQDFETGDESRNSLTCAILTWGEGWHNNHHWDFPSLELAKKLTGSVKRKTSELYWQGKTPFQRCFDRSGISIWCLIKLGVLRSL